MLKEGSAPMTAYESGAEAILRGREVGGDEGKDIQRDAVDGSEGILQFTDGYKCGRYVVFELRDHIIGEAMVEVSALFFNETQMFPRHTADDGLYGSAPC